MKIRQQGSQFSRYVLVGVVNNTVLYGVFLGLVKFEMHPVVATGLCFILGVLFSYVWNKNWAFGGQTKKHNRDAPRFLAAYAVGLMFSVIYMILLLKFFNPAVAQIINIGLTACVIYLLLNLLRFGQMDDSG